MRSSLLYGSCLTVLSTMLICNLSVGRAEKPREKPKDQIPGARWEFSLETKDGKEVGQGKFRAENLKVFQAARQVGTYTESGSQVTVTFTEGKLKGVASLVKTSNTPPRWKGRLKRADGSVEKMTLTLFKD